MTRWAISTATLALIAWPIIVAAPPAPAPQSEFDKTIISFVSTYCVNCHGPQKQSGSMSLHQFKAVGDLAKDRMTWETVVERLRSREMPPKGKKQPADAEREKIIAFIERELANASNAGPPNPGRVTLRRLNRVEFNNTIRDLFGMDLHPADDFPLDDVGYGFDNIGDVLSLSPLLMEKYLLAADSVLEKVFARHAKVKQMVRQFNSGERQFQLTSQNSVVLPDQNGRVLNEPCEMIRSFEFEHPGQYLFKVRAHGSAVDGEAPRIAIMVDGREIKSFEVKAGGGKKGGQAGEATTKLTRGEHKFGVVYLKPKSESKEPRSVTIVNMEVTGPLDPPPPEPTEAYKKVFFCAPNETLTKDECAAKILTSFARRAYRRPLTNAEIKKLVSLVQLAEKQGDSFDDGITLAIKAVLVSPHFLFRVEADPPTSEPNKAYPVSDLELASRLSYFLWSSMPDDELLQVAESGRLRKGDTLTKQIMRMLKDSKSRALAENFAGQWLQTRNLKTWAVDPKTFPKFDEPLRAAMIEETTRFFEAIVREDHSLVDFLDADYTFVNERLAKHYGISGVTGPDFRRVSLKGTPRAGILTHGSILTVTSNATRTSPVKRGKFIVENILGSPVPPPPPDVPELKEDDGHELTGSLRQRMEQHRTNPTCASCHNRMDPPGFAFENFDAIGGYRTTDGKFPIDASGSLPDGQSFQGPGELRAILIEKQDSFRRSLADKLMTYAVGRGLEHYDRPAINEVCRKTSEGGNRFSALVLAITTSDPFQKRANSKGTK